MLLSIEIMLNAVNLTFVAFGRYLGAVDGQIIVFFVMTVAAAEAAVGLALVIALFRHRESLNPDAFTLAEVVTAHDRMLLARFRSCRSLGFLVNAFARPAAVEGRLGRRRLPGRWSRRSPSSVGGRPWPLLRLPADARVDRPGRSSPGSRRATCRSPFALPARPAVGGDDPRRHRHRRRSSTSTRRPTCTRRPTASTRATSRT